MTSPRGQRPQRQFSAARLDGRQHPRRRVADQKEQRLPRRLLENFQQRVGCVGIQLVDGIDDADPPSFHRRGRTEERDRLARLVDRDDGAHHALVVERALERQQSAMGAGGDMASHRMRRIDLQRFGALHLGCQRIAMREHEPRHPIGQRRLADALRAADQPGMRNPPAAIGVQQRQFGLAMPEQRHGFARMRDGSGCLSLAGAHARLATFETSNSRKRSRTAVQTLAATAPAAALASISTQRCGSAAAICR